MREYTRRVRIYVATTGTDPEYRAGRLLEQLSGQAWRATETLKVEDLRCHDGVDRLLAHLWAELEPVEHLRVFSTLQSFYRSFRKHPGEEFPAFDTRFRVQLQRLDEIGAGISGITKSFWFLETAGLSNDLRKQVVAAAGGTYEYDRLRSAVMAIVPQVVKDESAGQGRGHDRKPFRPKNQYRVNMVEDGNPAEEAAEADQEDPEDNPEGGDEDAEDALALEQEAQVLLTEAAKKRSRVEKARGYQKIESTSQREERIRALKARMPCSACKAHGFTRYGHWHQDSECPYHHEKKEDRDKTQKVFAVTSHLDDGEDSEDDDEVYRVLMTRLNNDMWANPVRPRSKGLAMCDTCCAKSVAGENWASHHMRVLWNMGVDFFISPEKEAFKFGPGEKITSLYALVIPLGIRGCASQVYVRISIVPQEGSYAAEQGSSSGPWCCSQHRPERDLPARA
jgi:hypothetical protein